MEFIFLNTDLQSEMLRNDVFNTVNFQKGVQGFTSLSTEFPPLEKKASHIPEFVTCRRKNFCSWHTL